MEKMESDDWSCVLNLMAKIHDERQLLHDTESSIPVSNSLQTERLYFSNTYLFEAQSEVVELIQLENSKYGSHSILMPSTIFHPQGGGQPSDEGIINSCDGLVSFVVKFVQSTARGIEHHGSFDTTAIFSVGDRVELTIDRNLRVRNAQLHSAGHMIDVAMQKLGYLEVLKPSKGYHFADTCYVEFEGTIADDEIAMMPPKLNSCLTTLISSAIPTRVLTVSRTEAGMMCNCNTDNYPEVVRIVSVANMPCPCGGTHIENTNEIQRIVVTKAKRKKNVVKIFYSVY